MDILVNLAAGGEVALPDTMVTALEPGDRLAGLRGYAYTLVVYRDGVPIGHCTIEAAGYANVKEWLSATGGNQLWTK